jgi:ATP-dependent DNA ligase
MRSDWIIAQEFPESTCRIQGTVTAWAMRRARGGLERRCNIVCRTKRRRGCQDCMPTMTPGPISAVSPPPLQPKETDALPRGEDWIYEFLWGGERVRAAKDESGVRLLSREGRNLINRFPRVAACDDAVLDGEILMLDSCPAQVARFLAAASDDISQAHVALIAYDLLRLRRRDLREVPLLGRRMQLASLVQGTPIIVAPLFSGSSEQAMIEAARLGLDGVVAKRAGSSYRPNALTTAWLKVLLHPSSSRGGRVRGVAVAPSSAARQ